MPKTSVSVGRPLLFAVQNRLIDPTVIITCRFCNSHQQLRLLSCFLHQKLSAQCCRTDTSQKVRDDECSVDDSGDAGAKKEPKIEDCTSPESNRGLVETCV